MFDLDMFGCCMITMEIISRGACPYKSTDSTLLVCDEGDDDVVIVYADNKRFVLISVYCPQGIL